ncbi:protein Gawky isoform X1 [Pieris rapae]|uniref:protein Gawky isoform X1 n=1 Tax=Pieris rapae TaxID=64459 RepID=UPI001E27E5EA|nr:protein Gawky isoform X1 [Pieris rapae]XP_022121165.2 protein Gawky isoform X1 [Pieris rapae]XP_022121166.2 protein Gawky isoform X1 [Pieris rapae]XP_022121167.2 protein Gawky isoform X1 [Pieris rapae]XP_045487825.1 protein Gawky isoform X1 [Pieris rapae]
MSNVSVILCVPYLFKDNCYSNIDTVTEPMQCNYSTSMVVITNKIGAFKRVEEKNESQRVSVKMVDNNIYNVEFVDRIQQNQMIGGTPNYCIPLMINAITVQGISYSDPYFSSFNLNYKMAFGAPEYMNKSDYAFKSSVCIIRDEPCTNKTQLLNMESAHNNMNCKTRMITHEKSVDNHHDNKILSVGDSMSQSAVLKTFKNGDLTLDGMLALAENEQRILNDIKKSEEIDTWGVPRRLRLCGGGEGSLNAASGWGSPPTSNNAGNWGGNSSVQTNNGTNNTQPWNNNQRPPTSQADMNSNKGSGNQIPPTSAASQNWQSSPPNMPNSQSNNNSAPSSNGTNGNGSGSNMANANANANGPTSNGNNGNSTNNTSSAKIEQLNSMREALFSQDGWGGQHVNQDTNWDVPGSPEPGAKVDAAAGPPPWKPNINNGAFLGTDLWEAHLRNGGQPPPQPASKTPWGHTPTTNIGGTWGEDDDAADSANVWTGPPQQQWAGGPPSHSQQWAVPKKDDWNAWGEPHRPSDPRLDAHRTPDPRQQPPELRGGISGRLNGDMWNQHHQHTAAAPNKMMPSGAVNQWGSQGPKDGIKVSGWEEPSPPAARRAAGAFDDGTSLWAQRSGMGGGMARGAPQGPPAPSRIPPTPSKPEGVWATHSQRNGSWEESHAGWPDRDVPSWSDSSAPGLWPVPKPKPAGPAGAWPDDIAEWGGPKPPQGGSIGKQLTKEMVWNSKQFRILLEMGYKKEEAEAALRSRDMNVEEAAEMLAAARGDSWRRDDHFHHGPFQQQPAVPSVSPAVVQKLLNQPPPHAVQHHPSFNHNSGSGNSSQPSTAQLRMLVQQIQMAVTAGYLNHQILNQPLAPQTLVLLNQLLQQIKVLQQLMQQHTLAISKANSSLALQYSMQVSKTKQQITALQNQIVNQQALYMKQQAGGADLYKQSHDPLTQLGNNFSDMTIGKDSQGGYGATNQQSRLNQWKLPSLDKESEGTDFSRAPGTAKSATSPQLNQMGLQPDSTWGVGRGAEWGEGADVADGKDWPAHTHPPVYDLVPEFEPGKPWKGNQLKTVEDDPAMTPGSVVRSPLSLTAIKDSDMLGGKTSPPGGERSLSSSTWSYPPVTSAGGLKTDAWGAKGRVAPPGLNKWPQHHSNNSRSVPSWQASTWLLLKNLTAQIDGSTLKTLCVQHGPLQNFHLYLNQGVALARYSTREEAAKAQMALNNCVLSNTTIFAESPVESDVQLLLQHLGSSGGPAWRAGGGSKQENWGGFPGLWPDQHEARATPSGLNSFLPPDLLGGESI